MHVHECEQYMYLLMRCYNAVSGAVALMLLRNGLCRA